MAQLDLFSPQAGRRFRAMCALEQLDLDTVTHELGEHLAVFPDDRFAVQTFEIARHLTGCLAAARICHEDPVAALLAVGPEVPSHLRKAWHRRVARETERSHGPGCYIGGAPVGLHWLRGGDLEIAVPSLRDTLAGAPHDARARSYLADALVHHGDVAQARIEYARAFATDPAGVDLDTVADPEVAALPTAARVDYEAPGDPVMWIAAVGVVEGLFPATGIVQPEPDGGPGLAFLRLLSDEHRATTHTLAVFGCVWP